ncbi:amidase [Kitasatospora sp. NPDC006697]|uniref:amidase n=1 Tax=Kitasatospora sp. NPDC006697 TaxID=3364020 RepID=UPI0036A39398
MTDPMLDPFTPAVELAAAIRRRELSPVEVADCYLARMDALDPGLNAFCHRDDEAVRTAAAAAADAVLRAGSPEELPPFHGVPLPVKDLLEVAGWPTTFGSAGAAKEPSQASDPVVRRFTAAGFLPLGKTTTSEFGTLPFTESPALGTTRNPWDREHTPGGSSSGSAAAVAAGLAPIAHASDGGGSIRIPASCTGLVGLKPTRGLVTGSTIAVEGLSTSGVLSHTVADTAAALDVLARHDPAAWWSPPTRRPSLTAALDGPAPTGLRIGVLAESPLEGITVDPACTAAVDRAVRALEAAGHHVVDGPLPLPPGGELAAAFTTIWNTGGASYPVADPELVEPHNRALREAARATDSWEYVQAVKRTQQLSRRIVEGFTAHVDLLVTPTMACLPPRHGTLLAGAGAQPLMPLLNSYPMAVFTSIFNVTGQPAISLPLHHDGASGLPVGVQLVAAPWREDLLLRVARSLELALPWAGRHPVEP